MTDLLDDYDRDSAGCHVLMPIPDFIRSDPRCFYKFDATHPEYAVDSWGRECFAIDSGIAQAVQLLWDAGIHTTGCCDGHGSGDGIIGIATHDDGKPHSPLEDHDPYRPMTHSAERRYALELAAENERLRAGLTYALRNIPELQRDAYRPLADKLHIILAPQPAPTAEERRKVIVSATGANPDQAVGYSDIVGLPPQPAPTDVAG